MYQQVTVKEQQEWKIPPCISNWKNARVRQFICLFVSCAVGLISNARPLEACNLLPKTNYCTNLVSLTLVVPACCWEDDRRDYSTGKK